MNLNIVSSLLTCLALSSAAETKPQYLVEEGGSYYCLYCA